MLVDRPKYSVRGALKGMANDDNYRCIGCKLTFADEPERCPECKCTAFAKIMHPTTLGDTPRPADQWIQTYTGRQYWPLDPRPADVSVEDIAHHLGYICRFSGACRRFYSVAEHSIHVSHVVDAALMYGKASDEDNRRLVTLALMHDAGEFVPPHDVARPVKYAPECSGLRVIEARNQGAILEALELADVADPLGLVKQADNAMLLAEQESLMGPPPAEWVPMEVDAALLDVARYRMTLANNHGVGGASSPDAAGRAFLLRYRELTAFAEGVDY